MNALHLVVIFNSNELVIGLELTMTYFSCSRGINTPNAIAFEFTQLIQMVVCALVMIINCVFRKYTKHWIRWLYTG